MLKEIISIVREAGKLVLAARDVSALTYEKTSAADLVTEYDVAVENFLREKLLALLPDAVFFGKEKAGPADPGKGLGLYRGSHRRHRRFRTGSAAQRHLGGSGEGRRSGIRHGVRPLSE